MTDATPTAEDPVRVLLVDDSAVIRAFLRRFIEQEPDLKVTATAGNGQRAIEVLKTAPFDVVVLDIEMPVMDGLTALPLILKELPGAQVIIASTLTKQNAVITMKCFQAGAAECLAKPTSDEMSGAGSDIFRHNLVDKVRALGIVARRKRKAQPYAPSVPSSGGVAVPAASRPPVAAPAKAKTFELRKELVRGTPDIVAIGSSTGGPQALLKFFTDLGRPLKQPVLVTQHMPATFTTILADHISKQSGQPCREAVEGEVVEGGRIYLAPGNWHMQVRRDGARDIIALNQDPPENFCRPAVDPMLRSVVNVYGKRVLAVIFTGMGSDGLHGGRAVVEAGGTVIAQDEASSVVWGMPGAVAMAGLCSRVVPLDRMAETVRDYADSGVRG